jgi:hypothetical protein
MCTFSIRWVLRINRGDDREFFRVLLRLRSRLTLVFLLKATKPAETQRSVQLALLQARIPTTTARLNKGPIPPVILVGHWPFAESLLVYYRVFASTKDGVHTVIRW